MSLQFFSFRFAIYCLTHFQTGSLLPLSFILSLFPFISWPPFSSFDLPHHALLPVSVNTSFASLVFFPSLLFQSVSLVFFPSLLLSLFPLLHLSPRHSFLSSLLFYFSSLLPLCSLRSSTLLCSQTSLFSHVSSLLCFFFILSRSFCPPPHPRSSSLSYVISFFLSSMSIFSSLSLPFYLSFLSLSLLVSALCSPFSFLFPSLLSPFLISFFPPFSPHPFLLALILTFPTFLKERTNSVIRLWAEQTNNDHKPFHA